MYYTYMESPIGRLLLAGDKTHLKVLGFPSGNKARGAEAGWERYDEPFREAIKQLN